VISVFLSVVYVVRNQADEVESLLRHASAYLSQTLSDHELIIVDNASSDDTVNRLKELTGENGLPNLQVYALTREVDLDTATWVGMENALGDYVAAFDPISDDINFLGHMLHSAMAGVDILFAKNNASLPSPYGYRVARALFCSVYSAANGDVLIHDMPYYRLLSKRVLHFISQHPQPAFRYRHLASTAGFTRLSLEYKGKRIAPPARPLVENMDRAMRLLVSTTRTPMRLVTSLSLFGALANLFYSLYVLAVALFKQDIAPGWVSLSLQQSGMFFLISLVLLVLGEYMLHMASLSNEGPAYHIAQEFTSMRLTRKEKLNVDQSVGGSVFSREGGIDGNGNHVI
jgi:hypothetical protein